MRLQKLSPPLLTHPPSMEFKKGSRRGFSAIKSLRREYCFFENCLYTTQLTTLYMTCFPPREAFPPSFDSTKDQIAQRRFGCVYLPWQNLAVFLGQLWSLYLRCCSHWCIEIGPHARDNSIVLLGNGCCCCSSQLATSWSLNEQWVKFWRSILYSTYAARWSGWRQQEILASEEELYHIIKRIAPSSFRGMTLKYSFTTSDLWFEVTSWSKEA